MRFRSGTPGHSAASLTAGVVLAVGLLGAGLTACGSGVVETARPEPAGDPPTAEASTSSAPPTSTTEAPATTTTTAPCTPASAIAVWPLRRRLAQLLMPALPEGDPASASAMVSLFQPGGVFLSTGVDAANGTLGQALAGAEPVAPFVSIDEEGGRVERLAATVGSLPSARDMAATMSEDEVRQAAEQLGRGLHDRGITVDLAPVVDVSSQPDGAVIGDRSFSSDPAVTTAYAGAFADGLRAAGVLPVLKHFPGHGRSSGDSHQGVVTTPPLDDLRGVDLVPYQSLLDDEPVAVMMGHLDVPGLTEPGLPTSLSPAALRLLRDDLGFDGVVMTDDLGSMLAVTSRFSLPDAALQALVAGVDMVLWNSGSIGAVLDRLEQAVGSGELPEARVDESVARILRVKDVDPCALDLP